MRTNVLQLTEADPDIVRDRHRLLYRTTHSHFYLLSENGARDAPRAIRRLPVSGLVGDRKLARARFAAAQ